MKKGVAMRLNKNHWLLNKPVAHRGLWNENICENSLSAYKNAIDNGFPIEIDVYSSKDGVLMSFHDKSLVRMTGVEGFIFDKTYDELKELKLNGSDQEIPTLDQVLALCEGKTPLLIELKDQPDKSYVKRVVERLKRYKGEFAIQSFNPLLIKAVKKLAPEFIRGILGSNEEKNEKPFIRYMISKLPLNFIIKPDFISYCHSSLPLPKKIKKDLPVIAWTVTDKSTAISLKGIADNIIFEHFIP